MKHPTFTLVDLETTGSIPEKDRIIDIAVLVYSEKGLEEEYSSLINPGFPIPYRITRLTGITNKMVKDAPPFGEVAKKVMEITEGRIFVAHNVQFDYFFLKRELKRAGYSFQRKKLCTIRMSRNMIPALTGYGLERLCSHLDISIKNRHRALGDALATLEVFKTLLSLDGKEFIEESLLEGVRDSNLPPALTREALEEVPEEVGIYYFHNQRDQVIYVGTSKNIRQRVFQHFQIPENPKSSEIQHNLTRISYEITGGELMALLREAVEIKRLGPKHNRARRQKEYSHFLCLQKDSKGYLRMEIRRNKGRDDFANFALGLYNRREGFELLHRLIKHHQLCSLLCGMEKKKCPCLGYEIKRCPGACAGQETPEKYNQRVQEALCPFGYPHKRFVILEEGREEEETSVILVDGEESLAMGYINFEFSPSKIKQVRENLQVYDHHRDFQEIISQYLKKSKTCQVVVLEE